MQLPAQVSAIIEYEKGIMEKPRKSCLCGGVRYQIDVPLLVR
jgi:hypothetical protein